MGNWLKDKNKLSTGMVVALGVVGFGLIFGADFLATSLPQGTGQVQTGNPQSQPRQDELSFEAQYEKSLEKTISNISGVGSVTVDVFLASSPRYEYARSLDKTEKTTQDQSSGKVSQVTSETRSNSQITLRRAGAQEEPLILQTYAPEVQGVLVVAEGASNPQIRLNLTRAIQTALGIPAHRIRVLSKEGQQ